MTEEKIIFETKGMGREGEKEVLSFTGGGF